MNQAVDRGAYTLEVRQDGQPIGVLAFDAHEVGARLGTMLQESEMRGQRWRRHVETLEDDLRKAQDLIEQLRADVEEMKAEREEQASATAALVEERDAFQRESEGFQRMLAAEVAITESYATRLDKAGLLLDVVVVMRLWHDQGALPAEQASTSPATCSGGGTDCAAREELVEVSTPEAAPVAPRARRSSVAERMRTTRTYRRLPLDVMIRRICERLHLKTGEQLQLPSSALMMRCGWENWAVATMRLNELQAGGFIAWSAKAFAAEVGDRPLRRDVVVTVLNDGVTVAPHPEDAGRVVEAADLPPLERTPRTAAQEAADEKARTGVVPTKASLAAVARLEMHLGVKPGTEWLVSMDRFRDAFSVATEEEAVKAAQRLIHHGLLEAMPVSGGMWLLRIVPQPTSAPTPATAPATPVEAEIVEEAVAAEEIVATASKSKAGVTGPSALSAEDRASQFVARLGLTRVGDSVTASRSEIKRRVRSGANKLDGYLDQLETAGWMKVETAAPSGPRHTLMTTLTLLRMPPPYTGPELPPRMTPASTPKVAPVRAVEAKPHALTAAKIEAERRPPNPQWRTVNRTQFLLVDDDCGTAAGRLYRDIVEVTNRNGSDDIDAAAHEVLTMLGRNERDLKAVFSQLGELEAAGHVRFVSTRREGMSPLWMITPRGVRR